MDYKFVKKKAEERSKEDTVQMILSGGLKKTQIFEFGYTSGYNSALKDLDEKLADLMMIEKGMSKTINYIRKELEKEEKQ